jgi:transposase
MFGCAVFGKVYLSWLLSKESRMAVPYVQDLRDRVLAAYDRGMQTGQIVKAFGVSCAWAKRVKQVRREEGRLTRLPMGGVRVVKVDLEKLAALVDAQPDATIPELHRRLGGKDVCTLSAVTMALHRLELTYKKRHCMPASRTGPTSPKVGKRGSATSRRKTPDG